MARRSDTAPSSADIRRVAGAIGRLEATDWPHRHRQVGLAVLDAVHSVNTNHRTTVVPLLDRYVAHRRAEGADARRDTAADLRGAIQDVGGPGAFAAEVVGNRQLTSTSNGLLKATACLRLADALCGLGVGSAADLRRRRRRVGGLDDVESAWRAVPGQRSGRTWRWFLMMLSVRGPRVDADVRRWLAGVLGRKVDDAEATELLVAAADRAGLDPAQVDRRVSLECARRGSGRAKPPDRAR